MNSGYRWEMEWVDQTLYTFDCLLWGKHVCRLLIRKLVKKKSSKVEIKIQLNYIIKIQLFESYQTS